MKFVPRDIDRLADRLFDKIWKAPAAPIPDTVYHYTKADGLVGILTSKRVWATDCRSLNDETESELGHHHSAQDRAKPCCHKQRAPD